MKRLLLRILLILFFLFMIANPQLAVSGASTGLLLWFHSIIPSLLPFMILSNLLVSLNGISLFTGLLHPITKRLFCISKNGSYALLTGLVCGYPMGAKTCSDLLKARQISKQEAQYLLCFVNNPGPAFLAGYILQELLKGKWLAAPYFFSVYGAPLLFAACLHGFTFARNIKPGMHKRIQKKEEGLSPSFSPYRPDATLDFNLLDRAIMDGFSTVTRLGGYIILFSILSAFLMEAGFLSLNLKILLTAATEITTGSRLLCACGIPGNGILLGMAVCACVSFGGISGIFQTKSVISDTSLSLLPYIGSKLLISLLSALLYLLSGSLMGCQL